MTSLKTKKNTIRAVMYTARTPQTTAAIGTASGVPEAGTTGAVGGVKVASVT